MRVFVTSDLLWRGSLATTPGLAGLARFLCQEAKPEDVLLSLGNLAENPQDLGLVLNLFRETRCLKLAVLGNREIWATGEGETSQERRTAMARVLDDAGWRHLEDEPTRLGQIGFAGVMGWYDYSLRDDIGVPLAAYQNKIFPGEHLPRWKDALYARFGVSDERVTQQQVDRLTKCLKELRETQAVIVGMHHLPTRELLIGPKFLMPKLVRYSNAFQGSDRFQESIKAFPNVKWVFCGHIQNSKKVNIGPTRYVSIGSDENRKELLILENDKLTTKRFT